MLRARLLTVAVALPFLIWLVCYSPLWLFTLVFLAITGVALLEYFTLLRALNELPLWLGAGWGTLNALGVLGPDPWMLNAALLFGLFVAAGLSLRASQPARGLQSVGLTLLGVVYIGVLLPHVILLRSGPHGAAWVFFVFLVAMLGDTGAYMVGTLWGHHKLVPRISPGKTLEGSGGGLIANLLGAVVGWIWVVPQRGLGELVCLAAVVGVLAQVGDLFESAIKRAAGTKDSGTVLPGHGGILDRIDSLLFPITFIYYYTRTIHG